MKHIHYYIYALLFAATLAACSNDDFSGKLTTSDEVNGPITFSASAQTVAPTRASAGYREWATTYPQSMGVFGMLNGNKGTFGEFFTNKEVTYAETPVSPFTGKWSYTTPKYWPDYSSYNRYDFFAYMPYKAETTINSSDGTNFTVTIPNVAIDATDADNAVLTTLPTATTTLICHTPIHKEAPGDVIEYEMDQTLTAYQIQFELVDKMDKIRELVVKEVKIIGELPRVGTISRTYTWNGSAWTSGNITWGSLTKTANTYTKEIVNNTYTLDAYNAMWGESLDADAFAALTDAEKKELVLTSSAFRPWGNPFYVIPTDFTPTIKVKYDVLTEINHVLTRKEVESPIVFNSTNFSNYSTGVTGKINKINILIDPKFIYTLSDDDMRNALTIE